MNISASLKKTFLNNLSNNKKPFKEKKSLEDRKRESKMIKEKYPDRIPVIVERSGNNLPNLDKTKYLVPRDLSFGQFLYVIRKRLTLDSSIGLFLFLNNNTIVNCSMLMSDCFTKYKDEDGFLYIKYSGENTFG